MAFDESVLCIDCNISIPMHNAVITTCPDTIYYCDRINSPPVAHMEVPLYFYITKAILLGK